MKKKPKDEDEINTGRCWMLPDGDEEDVGKEETKWKIKFQTGPRVVRYLLEWRPRARVQFQVIAIV